MSFFVGGLAAGAIAVTVSLLLRLFVGGIFIPELESQTLFSLTPGQVESQAVERFGPLAKYSAFIGAVAANLILVWSNRFTCWPIAKEEETPFEGICTKCNTIFTGSLYYSACDKCFALSRD